MFLGDKFKQHSLATIEAAIAGAMKPLVGEAVECSIKAVDLGAGRGFAVEMSLTLSEDVSLDDLLP